MIDLTEDCYLISFDEINPIQLESFDCDNEDLNDFFKHDSSVFSAGLMGKSYAFILENETSPIVCSFTVANDSIKASLLPNSRKKKVQKSVSRTKYMRSYPAVMIGRLGVSKDFHHSGLGSQLMDFIKYWFCERSNKTGCRYIVVDAYKNDRAIQYYQKNGFDFLFSTEEQEKEYVGASDSAELNTRLMYFDLIQLNTN